MRFFGKAALPAWALALALSPAVGAQAQSVRSFTPDTDFSKICAKSPKPHLTRDWSQWTKAQPVGDPEEMYAAATAYAEGSRMLDRDPLTARRLLEALAERVWAGQDRAHFRLAKLFLDPVAGPVDAERAATHLRAAVSMQNMDAAVLLARLHEQGRIEGADVAEAERLLRSASAAGHVDGVIGLARLQRSGRIGPVPRGATDDLAALALQMLYGELKQGKCSALYRIASLLSDETLVPGGLKEAVRWFEAASRQGDAKADLALAEIDLQGRGATSSEPVMRHLEKAAEAGEPRAMTLLGERLLVGDRAPKDFKKAVMWLERAGLNADQEAYKLLARHYRGEFGAAPNLSKAAEALTKASLLPGQSASVLASLARLYATGIDGKPDVAAALAAYRRAAVLGDVGSLTEMAKILLADPQAGSSDEPLRLLKQAAAAGRVDAMRYLARGYASGQFGDPDLQRAIAWFAEALRGGDANVAADLARLAATPGADGEKALALLKESAVSGFASSMREYGRILQLGLGEDAQPEAGAAWLRKAAEAGDTAAMKELSQAYASGYGVELSARISTEWLQRAAQAGDPEAMHNLGLAMTLGFGTDANAKVAQEWLRSAEGAGRR
ncbi:TPR repeat protein [Microvirga flocculans]|uniref:TPR repeat protein n=1 Tax=Microvirga flocculans TaxID=217168 RepID=A0A7W6ICS5_9HYPH|nr:SEL1-like repeat protein [Microvirga flocculans]MBB4039009.1 TPR repeat protein [Microvirga flocculans]